MPTWVFKASKTSKEFDDFCDQLNIDTTLASCLWHRGICSFEQAKSWFNPSITQLHSPFLMKDMTLAVDRIIQALCHQETIMVYGDYDVDGTTAIACVYECLLSLSPNLLFYQPDRYSEGYGVSQKGMEFALKKEVKLIITLDCGITAHESIGFAQKHGMDVIVCDHHNPSDTLPPAIAILNPKQKDCPYPFKELSGCGVGFKLMQALSQNYHLDEEIVWTQLDLLALSIAADLVSMTGENRILCALGIQRIKNHPRPSLKKMIENIAIEAIQVETLVFQIAPKINAAGRIHHANKAVALLLEKDDHIIQSLLIDINQYNQTRKSLDSSVLAQGLTQLEHTPWDAVNIVADSTWHKGVLGIVASKIIEKRYLPTLVFGEGKSSDSWVGSARSVAGFDLFKALSLCSQHIEQFGGHAFAAGLTLKKDQFFSFCEALNRVVKDSDNWPFEDQLWIDSSCSFDKLTPKHLRILMRMEPFGPDSMYPLYHTPNVLIKEVRVIGQDQSHLRFVLEQSGVTMVGIGFGMAHRKPKKNDTIDLVFQLQQNHFNKMVTPQLMIKDWKETQPF